MANSLSAKKRIRQNAKRRLRNRARKSAVKTQIKNFLEVAAKGVANEALTKELRLVQKKIDKLVSYGIIHRNKAARQKSQLTKRYNEVVATA